MGRIHFKHWIAWLLVMAFVSAAKAEETFVTIHRVNGNYLLVSVDESANAEVGMQRRRRSRGGGRGVAPQMVTVAVPQTAKITTAIKERRTFEFRALGELAGGLRHDIFRKMNGPLPARIVTDNQVVTEVNVITPQADINQSATTAAGQSVIAVRPKRPPTKTKED